VSSRYGATHAVTGRRSRPRPVLVPEPRVDVAPPPALPAIADGVYQLTGTGPLARNGRQIRVRTVRIVEMLDLHGEWSPFPDQSAGRLAERVVDGRAQWVAPA
jgi:hypothetical protein